MGNGPRNCGQSSECLVLSSRLPTEISLRGGSYSDSLREEEYRSGSSSDSGRSARNTTNCISKKLHMVAQGMATSFATRTFDVKVERHRCTTIMVMIQLFRITAPYCRSCFR